MVYKDDAVKGKTKIRKLYHIDSEDAIFVREYAAEKGVSESEVIRMSLRRLQKDMVSDPFVRMIGTVKAIDGDAVQHDDVIYE